MARSIEEQVEDNAKRQLDGAGITHHSKTDFINDIIETALKSAPSKSGGGGPNYPDIKVIVTSPKDASRNLPVMMEAKGTKGKLIKLAKDGTVANTNSAGDKPNYTNINGFAVNGAVHYAQAIVNGSNDVYTECLAIGLNGYEEGEETIYETEVWYVDKENFALPKKIGNYDDLSFLFPEHQETLFDELDRCVLTEQEIEEQKALLEAEFDGLLADYNQYLRDELNINADNRIALTVGLILASIGADGVAPLKPEDFKGETGSKTHDGRLVYNKIESFLEKKGLPESERRTVMNYLEPTFNTTAYYTPMKGGISKIALAHTETQKILPSLLSTHRIDYMGRLFNKLLAWASLANDEDNDVVLTPRYITDFMARLGRVDMNSYVWDWAAGTGGFLVSAMNRMMRDAEERISSPEELTRKKQSIRGVQLLGIEIRGDIYLLNLLNMLLLDGSFSNVLQADSLNKAQFDGDYPYNVVPTPFPADTFLLNPPYSAPGKGLNFVERALGKMKSGYGVVITQENAGAGQDDGYGAKILAKHSLVASIHMPLDLFHGKSSVQTAIFVFKVGKPHDPDSLVKFIDMSEDGYVRTDRKKNKKVANLQNKDHAPERYDEVVNLVLNKKVNTDFYKSEHYIEDTITTDGNDWTYKQHQDLDRDITEEDLLSTIGTYLEWRTSNIAFDGSDEFLSSNMEDWEYPDELDISNWKKFTVGNILKCDTTNKVISKTQLTEGTIPYITRTAFNNGLDGFCGNSDKINPGNAITIGAEGFVAFYQGNPYVAGNKVYKLEHDKLNEQNGLFICAALNVLSPQYSYSNARILERIEVEEIMLPADTNGEPDWEKMKEMTILYMHKYIRNAYKKRCQQLKTMSVIWDEKK